MQPNYASKYFIKIKGILLKQTLIEKCSKQLYFIILQYIYKYNIN